MELPALLVPTYLQMLGALSSWLEKAEASGRADDLLSASLAPDMFPLSTQVRFACVQALEGVHRIGGRRLPDAIVTLLDEGRGAAERPGSLLEARVRIAETMAAVEIAAEGIDALDPSAPLAHKLPDGMVFDLTAGQYCRDWALPQFYFHLMTAYAILRAQGVELGKADYVAHMFAYLRPHSSQPR